MYMYINFLAAIPQDGHVQNINSNIIYEALVYILQLLNGYAAVRLAFSVTCDRLVAAYLRHS